jgi:hypothetical protein
MTDEGSAVKAVVTDTGSAALRLRLRRRLAHAVEGRRFRLLRQSQPAQPQIAALGRQLRRTRQFRPPRALGGLSPAIHHIGRHHTRSHTTHTASGAAATPLREPARRPWSSASIPAGACTNKGKTRPHTDSVANCGIATTHLGCVSSELAPIYVILTVSTLICHARPCAGHPRLVFLMR